MGEIVKYDNQMNRIAFTKMSAIDIDLFMLICAKVKDRKDELIKFSFTELKKEIGLSNKTDKYFNSKIQSVAKKLKTIGGSFSDGVTFDEFMLFPTFHGTHLEEDHAIFGHLKKGTLVVRVNPDYAFLLNELTKNFTRFELPEFVKLESKYSKSLYRLLKQYRKTGTYKVGSEKFRELMSCPESYTNIEFMRTCVNVAVKELSQGYFEELKVTPIRGITRGRPVVAYEFTFKPSDQVPGQMRMEDYAGVVPEEPRKKKPVKTDKTKFSNFPEREYDDDYYREIERSF